MLFSVYITLIM